MQYRIEGRTLVVDGSEGGGAVTVPLPDAHWQMSYRNRLAPNGRWVVIEGPGARQEFKSTASEVAALRSAMVHAYLDDPLVVECQFPGFLRKKPARLSLEREGCNAAVEGKPHPVTWEAFAKANVGKGSVTFPTVGTFRFAPDARTRFWLEAYKDYAAGKVQEAAQTTKAQPPAPVTVEVQKADGTTAQVKADELKAMVLRGEAGRKTPCRISGAATGAKQAGWAPLEKVATTLPALRPLYRPIRHYALQGLAIGAAVGYVLKALDSVLGFLMVDNPQVNGIGLLLAAVLALPIVGAKFPKVWPAAIVGYFMISMQNKGFALPFNPFIAMLAVMLVGFLTIGPIGAFIGGLVGWFKARKGRVAPDAKPESGLTYFMTFGFPGIFLAVWIPAYIWLNYKMLEWLAK